MPNEIDKLVVIDVETTGLNPFKHQVTAVALLPMYEGASPRVVYVRPADVTWSTFAKSYFKRYTREWNQLAVEPIRACEEIEAFLAEEFGDTVATPVGHNIGFDVAFLRQLAHLGGRDQFARLSHRVVDTHTLLFLLHLRGEIPSGALSSDGAFAHFGISVPRDSRHTAVGDVIATKELFKRAMDRLNSPTARKRTVGLVD